MVDAVIISDLHLGSPNCRAKALCHFLKGIKETTRRLILNGDVFDSIDMRRLKKYHWNVLSEIRKMSDNVEVIWIAGNHDGPAEIMAQMIGTEVVDEYILESGDKKILILHGDRFDKYIQEKPVITWIGDTIYWLLQLIDSSHYIARMAKHSSKEWLHNAETIQAEAIKLATKMGCDAAVCGHVHHAVAIPGLVSYYNTGCWTEAPCSYLEVCGGAVSLNQFEGEYIPHQTG